MKRIEERINRELREQLITVNTQNIGKGELKGIVCRLADNFHSCDTLPGMKFYSNLAPNSVPADARVDYVYTPTYLACATIMVAVCRYPEWLNIRKIKETLHDGLTACTGREFMGSGYDNTAGFLDAMDIFAQGQVNTFISMFPEFNSVFSAAIRKAINHLETNICSGIIRDAWSGENYAEPGKFILARLKAVQPNETVLFVYGSLMKGQSAHELIKDSVCRGKYALKDYAMFDLGAYPGIKERNGETVVGEVYVINKNLIPELDRYESEGSLFVRKQLEVVSDKEKITANAYVYLGSVEHKPMKNEMWGVKDNDTIWYACYGSNLSEERFDCYETFNVHHPADFTGHSLSVSDVVVIHQYGRDRAFFCDSVGFPEIKGFFEEKVIEEPEQPKVIDVSAEDVGEVISSSDGIPAEEETVGAEELSQDIAEAENFVITDNNIGVGTPSQRYQNNVNAIKTLHELQAENRLPTPSEQKILSQYVGWGGLSDNLRPGSTHSYELNELLSQEEYRAACDSVLTAFYTPPLVVKSIYKALNNMGFTNGTILDPACGTGHFFGLLPDYLRGNVTLHGIEIDKISGEIAQMLYPNANIKVQGYEETKIPDNYLDVIVGNVPFGDYTVFDKAYNKHHLMIHDYFFVKSLDKVRPGGIIAFITSTGTMDKHNPIVRELLAEKADLLGAIRLPNNTFKAAAGTDVSSDIIFLQKRTSTELLRQYPDWCYTVKYDDEREINSYFAAHPEMICGKLELKSSRFGGMDVVCVPNEDTSLADELNHAIQNIQGTYVPYTAANETNEESEAESVVADEAARNYSFFVKDETIYYRENGLMTVVPYTGKKAERIKELVKLTDVTRKLIQAEASGYDDDAINPLRQRLNAVYDSFYRDYGSINSFANNVFKKDNSYPLLCSLENITTDEITEKPIVSKADIFFTRTIAPNIEITSADNAEEALIISMSQRGRVDLEYMAKLTGNSQEKLIAELNGDSIFLKPYEGEYVTDPRKRL